jgi:hypothetical protein
MYNSGIKLEVLVQILYELPVWIDLREDIFFKAETAAGNK